MNIDALKNLDPDELAMLKQAIMSMDDGGGEAPEMGDEEDEGADIDKIVQALQYIYSELCNLKKLVVDDLFGSMDNLYNENEKKKSIADLQGKYGSMFDPYKDVYKEIEPDEDFYDSLHGLLSKKRGESNWNDEQEGSIVQQIIDSLKGEVEKKAKAFGSFAPKEAPVVQKETTVVSAEPKKDEKAMSKEDDLAAHFKKIKEGRKKSGLPIM